MPQPRGLAGGLRGQPRRPLGFSPIGSALRPPEPTLTAFGGLFMLVGTVVWWLFWYADAEPPTGMRKWGSALFAFLFFLAGLQFFVGEARKVRWWAERRFRGGREPWGEGYRWSRTMRPLPEPVAGWGSGCVGAAMLAVFAAVINLIWLDTDAIRGSRWLAYVLVPLFTALIVAVLAAALVEAAKRLLGGSARLRLEEYPVAPGGRLRATLECRRALLRGRKVKATLACVEETRRPADGGARRAAVEIVAAQERSFDPAPEGTRGTAIELQLPADAPPNLLARPEGNRRYWVLEVSAGGRKGWTFAVPVYAA